MTWCGGVELKGHWCGWKTKGPLVGVPSHFPTRRHRPPVTHTQAEGGKLNEGPLGWVGGAETIGGVAGSGMVGGGVCLAWLGCEIGWVGMG